MHLFRAIVSAFCVAFLVAPAVSLAEESATAAEYLKTHDQLTIFTQLVETAGLLGKLDESSAVTVFAPSDSAFATLPEGVLDELKDPENSALLKRVIGYHISPSNVLLKDVDYEYFAETLSGDELIIEAGERLYVDDATVTAADIACTNGMVHIIDAIVLPRGIVL